MARLLIPVLAAATTTYAFKTPKSRALKARGGIDIQKVGTALIGLDGLETMSPFSKMFAQLLGSCLLSGGAYTAVLAKGDSQEKAFGYAYAVIAAAALKAGLINAGEVGRE